MKDYQAYLLILFWIVIGIWWVVAFLTCPMKKVSHRAIATSLVMGVVFAWLLVWEILL